MKILLIRGNPRKNGVCQRLSNFFALGLKDGGAEVLDVNLSDLKISPCLGCFSCARNENAKCVVEDDMKELCSFLDSADALVCVSPVYFYSMSGISKNFFDRLFPFIDGYFHSAGNFTNDEKKSTSKFSVKNKKFLTISVASGRLNSTFDGLSKTYKLIADALNFDYTADIRRAESPYFSSLGAKSSRVGKIVRAFKTAGEIFARTGNVSAEMLEILESEISPDDEIFLKNSKIYWELLKNKKLKNYSREDAKKDFCASAREACFQISKALKNQKFSSEKFSIKFTLGESPWSFVFNSSSNKGEFFENFCAATELAISIDFNTWEDFIIADLSLADIILAGKASPVGDEKLFDEVKESLHAAR